MLKLIPPTLISFLVAYFYPIPGAFLIGFMTCLWLFITLGKKVQQNVVQKLERIIEIEREQI